MMSSIYTLGSYIYSRNDQRWVATMYAATGLKKKYQEHVKTVIYCWKYASRRGTIGRGLRAAEKLDGVGSIYREA